MKKTTIALVLVAALSTAACGGGNKAAANNSAGATTNEALTDLNAAAVIESNAALNADATNTLTSLPPLGNDTNAAAPHGNGAAAH